MGTDVVKSYDSLQRELEKAKNNLKGLNDNIRRIIGRDPQTDRNDRKRGYNDTRRGAGDSFNNNERQRNRDRELSPIQAKRRQQETKSVFSRLSGPPVRDDDQKPKIHSRVIRELPTRQEIVAAQGTDEESRARNRRMFGCLLGTLQKFCQEESRLKQKEEKKAKIEKKLEQQEQQERENMKKERQNLFSDRKRQQMEIRMLELKMTRLREFEVWEKSKQDLRNFIKTKTKPHIYYKPKVMTEELEKKLEKCRTELEDEIEKKRTEVNEEISSIENRFKMREEQILGKETKIPEESTKHDRRNDHDDDDEDEEHDSIYGNSDDDHLQQSEERHDHHEDYNQKPLKSIKNDEHKAEEPISLEDSKENVKGTPESHTRKESHKDVEKQNKEE